MIVTSQLTKSTNTAQKYKFDLPNIAFGPRMSRKCMARRSSRHVPRENESFSPGCCCIEQH